MAINFSGFGSICQRVPGALGIGSLDVLRASSIDIEETLTTDSALSFPTSGVGILQEVDLMDQRSVWEITLQRQSVDTPNLDALFNQRVSAAAMVAIPVYKTGSIPSGTPYTITETGLTVDQVVEAEVFSAVAPGNVQLTQIANAGIGTVATGQFGVGANTLTFASAQAGLNVGYFYKKSMSLAYRGGTQPLSPLGEFDLFFQYQTTRTTVRNLWFPRIRRNSGVSLSSSKGEVDSKYKALVPAGWNLPYMEWSS